ncbi:Cytochrome P450 [Neofusicoccum parvum]|uniref:Cytochrome P450 n=1 Tax=Neofusicoccum parvum TaxID=310453 RepID=A0ACB5SCB7_9PEZI|nr:Cytochrome P450 [Neofusicoccum parvum]
MALISILSTISPSQASIGVVVFSACLLVLRSIFRAAFSPLRSVPGPFLARFTRLWYLYKIWEGDFEKTQRTLHRRYGSIVRLTPYEYSFDDPTVIRTIYGHGTSFTKAPFYHASANLDYYTEDLFSGRDPKVHSMNRRKVAPLYSMTAVLRMEEPVNEAIEVFEKSLRHIANSELDINLQWWLQCFAFDAIAAISVGKRFGFLDEGKDPLDLVNTIEKFLFYSTHVGVYHELHQAAFKIMKRIGAHGSLNMWKFSVKQIEERLNSQGDPEKKVEGHDFLAGLLRFHQEEPQSFLMKDVIATINGNIMAGSDTTSISLTSIIWNMLRTPRVTQRLRAEIEEKAACGELSDPITFAEAQKMPYLQAVIQEGLRMHPVFGISLWRQVPRGGAQLAGKFFPEGTVVGSNAWQIHANKSVFGDDADQFRPERWLEGKEKSVEMDRYFLTFGYGSRVCIGKNIAFLEMYKLVPTLVRKFDFELCNPDAEVECSNRTLVKQHKIKVSVRMRE